MLRCAVRGMLLGVIIAAFLAGAQRPRNDHDLRRTCLRTSRWSRRAARLLGLRSRRQGALIGGQGRLLVANHLSYLDPLLLAAERPLVFVTSLEVAGDSLLGRISAAAGCCFVDRQRLGGLRLSCTRFADLLRAGHDLVVFPEATSGDGSAVLPFRPACFAAALAADTPVQPLALRYERVGGRPCTPRLRRQVAWYGDMTFLPHLIRLLALPRIDARWQRLPPCHGEERKALAREAREAIATALDLPQHGPDRRRTTAADALHASPTPLGFAAMSAPVVVVVPPR